MSRTRIAALIAIAALTLTAGAIFATTFDECATDIAVLRTETLGATLTGQNAEKDRTSLVGKLDSAQAKLDQGKFADAIQKLSDFRGKVEALQAAGKIDPADAATLIAGADAAILCIQNLAAGV